MMSLDSLIQLSSKVSFLSGAGVSKNFPSNIPIANQMIHSILNFFCPKDSLSLFNNIVIQFEMIIDIFKDEIDEELRVFDYYEKKTEPNLIHFMISHCISCFPKKYNLLTTNFDYLFECALNQLAKDTKERKFSPIISRKDYNTDLGAPNEIKFIKIHGSKKNYFTNENTIESLITTTRSLGKNRPKNQTFAIESYKLPLVKQFLKNSTLVVLGYSGTDYFDLQPLLIEDLNLKKIIWIQHSSRNEQFSPKKITKESKKLTYEHEKLLFDISKRKAIDCYIIEGNTTTILRSLLEQNVKLPVFRKLNKIHPNGYTFDNFLAQNFTNISDFDKLFFVSKLLRSLTFYEDSFDYANRGIDLSVKYEDWTNQYRFLMIIVDLFIKSGDYEPALEIINNFLSKAEKMEDKRVEIQVLSQIGVINLELQKFDEAIFACQMALNIIQKTNTTIRNVAALYNTLGWSYYHKNNKEICLNNFELALKYCSSSGDLYSKSAILSSLGSISFRDNDLDKAKNYNNEALRIDRILGNKLGEANRLNNLGLIFYGKKKYSKAITYTKKSLEIYQNLKIEDSMHALQIIKNLSELHIKIQKYYKAIEYLEIGKIICEKHKQKDEKNAIIKEIIMLKKKMKKLDT